MHKVLIIDDDHLIRMYLKATLVDLNFTDIKEAGDGKKAIQAAEQQQPELILLDINLPDCDGIDLLGKLHTVVPDGKIVMVSSEATVDRIKMAQKKGSIGFIAKPFNATTISQKITKIQRGN